MLSVEKEMAPTPVEKCYCVLEFEKTRYAVAAKHRFRTQYCIDPHNGKSIYEWQRKCSTTGFLSKGKGAKRHVNWSCS